jgi:hypothetical protein
MQGFKSAGHAQRFLAAYGPIAQHFRPRRHRFSAPVYPNKAPYGRTLEASILASGTSSWGG